MGGPRQRALAAGLAVLSLAAPLGAAREQDPTEAMGAVGAVGAALARGEHGLALELAGDLEGALGAEWAFHIHYTAGDLPGALRAAREGLASWPGHPRLLENAARCALALGRGEAALESATALVDLDLEPAVRERAEPLLEASARLVERDARARRGLNRARWASALLLCLAAGLMAGLGWLGGSARARS